MTGGGGWGTGGREEPRGGGQTGTGKGKREGNRVRGTGDRRNMERGEQGRETE